MASPCAPASAGEAHELTRSRADLHVPPRLSCDSLSASKRAIACSCRNWTLARRKLPTSGELLVSRPFRALPPFKSYVRG